MNNYTRYYDRDNSQNSQSARQNCIFNHQPPFDASGNSSSGLQTPEKKEETHRDERNRRVISRRSLFEDPDLFYCQDKTEETQQTSHDHTGYPWAQGGWLRAGEETNSQTGGTQEVQGTSGQGNRLQKKLNTALSQPVQMNKAASMMEKMGWQGGALGRTGDGIVEPIAPNAAYATKTRGFGQAVAKPPPKKQASKYQEYNMEYFNTNSLLHILEFVRNDKAIEVMFDPQLFKNERKTIHWLVNDVINNSDLIDMTFDNIAQMDIVEDIHKYNRNILCTQSEGIHPNRMLCLYKEAPENVYLITPDDLSDEPPAIAEITDEKANADGSTSEGETKSKVKRRKRHGSEVKNDAKADNDSKTEANVKMEVDEEENPFLRSITRNLKKGKESDGEVTTIPDKDCSIDTKNKDKDTIDKIVEYFVEFVDQEMYTEFRFLGEFKPQEIDSINAFLTNVFNCINSRTCNDKKYESVLKSISKDELLFEMNEDCNEGPVILKFRKENNK